MIGLCAIWGVQQVAIKWAMPELPPLWQSGLRSVFAALLIGGWMVWKKRRWTRGLVPAGLLVGFLFGLEFGLVYLALRYTDAGRAALLLYTQPFFVALGAHFLLKGERLSASGWIGIALAFIGTAVMLQTSFGVDSDKALGDFLALGAGLAWGLTSLAIRKTGLSEADPSQTLLYQLAVSAVMLCMAAVIWERVPGLPRHAITWWAMFYQIAIVASASFLAWFGLVARYSVTKLAAFTFITPVFAALAGFVFLGERVSWNHVASLVLIIFGIVIVNYLGHEKSGLTESA